jgi:hypothetical protein
MDMNDLLTALDAIAARSDGPLSEAKIGAHFGGASLKNPMVHSTNNVSGMIEINDSCLLGTIRIRFVSSRPAVTKIQVYQPATDRKFGKEESCENFNSRINSHFPFSQRPCKQLDHRLPEWRAHH